MYQLFENSDSLGSVWKKVEEQPSFPEWDYSQPDTSSTGNFEWHPDDFLIQDKIASSNGQSPRDEGSPGYRDFTPQSPSSTSANSKETAHSRRLSQNRTAQRAFRARQREHVECLEQQLKTVVNKYEELQQRYSSLSASHERLRKEQRKTDSVKNDEGPRPSLEHVTDAFWRQYALEGDLPTSNWQQ